MIGRYTQMSMATLIAFRMTAVNVVSSFFQRILLCYRDVCPGPPWARTSSRRVHSGWVLGLADSVTTSLQKLYLSDQNTERAY